MTTEVHYYRYYCQTESNFVYKWDTSAPSTCPNNQHHTIDSNSITIIDTVSTSQVELVDAVKTQFQESVSLNKQLLLSLQSSVGKSTLRDNYVTIGSATILNNNNSEYQMLVTGSNDKASITSVERVKCYGHLTNEACFGVRIPQTLSSNQYIRFGMYDSGNSNGVFFKYDKNGMGIGFQSSGTGESNITQSNLNVDMMDGNGVSSVVLQPSKGYVYGLRVSGNGPRAIEYGVYSKSMYGDQRFYVMHRLFTNDFGNKPFLPSHLPLTVEIANNGISGSNNVYLSDRSFAVYGDVGCVGGDHVANNRTNSLYVPSVTIATSSDYVPIVSLRKKSAYVGVETFLEGLDVICSSPQVILVMSGSTLMGSSWQTLPLQVATETAIEYDTSASAVSSDGVMIWQGLAPSGSMTFKIPKCLMNGTSPLVMLAKNVSSSGTITLVVRAIEAW
jgi:hypothetical protein